MTAQPLTRVIDRLCRLLIGKQSPNRLSPAMPPHIPTAEALKQGLPGSDVYRGSHLLYHDELNRDAGVIRLNQEALKAFADTVLVAERHEIAAEQAATKEWLRKGGFASGEQFPMGRALIASMRYANFEHLKIASAFEIHLKARLLARDYMVHYLDPNAPGCAALAKEQRRRPILKGEVFAIHQYCFDGHRNYLPGLKEESLKFSRLTNKPLYRAALGLAEEQLDIIEDYRLLRNQIHLPADVLESPHIQAYPKPIISFILTFINTEIVDWSNALIARHNLGQPSLARIS